MACNRGLHVYFGGRPCQGQQNQLQRSWGPKHCWVFPLLPVQQKEGKNTSLGNENPGPRPGPSWEALDRKWLGNKHCSLTCVLPLGAVGSGPQACAFLLGCRLACLSLGYGAGIPCPAQVGSSVGETPWEGVGERQKELPEFPEARSSLRRCV